MEFLTRYHWNQFQYLGSRGAQLLHRIIQTLQIKFQYLGSRGAQHDTLRQQ